MTTVRDNPTEVTFELLVVSVNTLKEWEMLVEARMTLARYSLVNQTQDCNIAPQCWRSKLMV